MWFASGCLVKLNPTKTSKSQARSELAKALCCIVGLLCHMLIQPGNIDPRHNSRFKMRPGRPGCHDPPKPGNPTKCWFAAGLSYLQTRVVPTPPKTDPSSTPLPWEILSARHRMLPWRPVLCRVRVKSSRLARTGSSLSRGVRWLEWLLVTCPFVFFLPPPEGSPYIWGTCFKVPEPRAFHPPKFTPKNTCFRLLRLSPLNLEIRTSVGCDRAVSITPHQLGESNTPSKQSPTLT